MKAKLKFLGGLINEITGSCYLLRVHHKKKRLSILIDAGLVQCNFNDSFDKNKEILNQIDPGKIDYIILTHSHIDHIGRLPLLIKNGFKGRIICTEGTASLLKIMLEDSAKIQVAEAIYLNKKNNKALESGKADRLTRGAYDSRKKTVKKSPILPLYTIEDVSLVDGLVKNGGYPYHQWIHLSKDVSVKFYASGHVMGGAVTVFRFKNKSQKFYFGFSGDLGRQDGIILPPPELIKEDLRVFVTESTYGGRVHPSRDDEICKIIELVKIAVKKKKRIIIPSFALERAQEIIYLLSYHMSAGGIPKIPIFLDSPLASKITKIFAQAWSDGMFSDQSRLDFNPFSQENPYLKIITDQKESDDLIAKSGPYIVIAGSGDCNSGRVRGHLRTNLPKEDTMIFLVGYMPKNSLGRNLKERMVVKMNQEEIKVKAEIISFDSFSAHADSLFLRDYVYDNLKWGSEPKNIFIVHGELEGARTLKINLDMVLSDKLIETMIPENGFEFLL